MPAFFHGLQFSCGTVKNRCLTRSGIGRILGPMEIQDAPEIRRIERFGTLLRERAPRCPVCGAECEWIYKYKGVDAVGCERCLVRRDAWEEDVCGGNR